MNALSWLIYAAHAFGSVREVLALSAIMLGSGLCFATFFRFLFVGADSENRYQKGEVRFNAFYDGKIFKVTGLFLVLALSTAVIPNQKTLHLIIASEIGESAIDSPEFKKLKRLLNKELDALIGDGSGEKGSDV